MNTNSSFLKCQNSRSLETAKYATQCKKARAGDMNLSSRRIIGRNLTIPQVGFVSNLKTKSTLCDTNAMSDDLHRKKGGQKSIIIIV